MYGRVTVSVSTGGVGIHLVWCFSAPRIDIHSFSSRMVVVVAGGARF